MLHHIFVIRLNYNVPNQHPVDEISQLITEVVKDMDRNLWGAGLFQGCEEEDCLLSNLDSLRKTYKPNWGCISWRWMVVKKSVQLFNWSQNQNVWKIDPKRSKVLRRGRRRRGPQPWHKKATALIIFWKQFF